MSEKKTQEKKTQTSEILKYLQNNGTITSWEAIERFGATRLSAIIYSLRHKYGYNIGVRDKEVVTRYGRKVIIAEYIYFGCNQWDRFYKNFSLST